MDKLHTDTYDTCLTPVRNPAGYHAPKITARKRLQTIPSGRSKSDELPATAKRIQPCLLTAHSSSVTPMSRFFIFLISFLFLLPALFPLLASLDPSVRLVFGSLDLFESISVRMEEPAVSVAWFLAVWQKVTSSCSVMGGRDGTGWDGMGGCERVCGRGRGEEREREEGRDLE